MKKLKMVSIIVLTALITLSIYLIYNRDKFRNIESTNLSGENIGGISLMEKYNANDIEEMFGILVNKGEGKNYYFYEYQEQDAMLYLEVDKDNNIIEMDFGFGDTSIKTNKGLTKDSTFADVKKSYGNNFLKEEYSDFMGSGDWYTITYVDKSAGCKISFVFNEYDNGSLTEVILSKY